jgi:hypothetical protein
MEEDFDRAANSLPCGRPAPRLVPNMTTGTTCKVPLTVGVTGHRDLFDQDVPEVRQRLESIFKQLHSDYPATPVRLLSALAEGADRLAAQAALSIGVQLTVCLPMPRGEYEKDFVTAESKEEFSKLLQSSNSPPAEPGAHVGIAVQGCERDLCYERAGAFIVRHSHILIAVWDGKDPMLVGGTAAVVNFKLNGLPQKYAPERGPLDAPDVGPVFHIPARRQREGQTSQAYADFWKGLYRHDEPGNRAYHLLLPPDGSVNDYEVRLAKINEFNSATRFCSLSALEASRQEMFPRLLPEDTVLSKYCAADVLAQRFQRRHHWATRMIYGCAVGMAATFSLYHTFLPDWRILLLYLLVFVVMVATFAIQSLQGYDERFLDCRALAEGLRVQLFWQLAGLTGNVAHSYLRKQSEAIEWIRDSLRAIALVPAAGEHALVDENERKDLIKKHWISHQLNYFERASHRDARRVSSISLTSYVLYAIGLVVAIFATCVTAKSGVRREQRELMILLMGLPPAVAALYQGYSEHMSFKDHAMEYERMKLLYSRADKLSSTLTFDEFQKLVEDLGKEALLENGDWLIVHRRRPVRIQ